MQQLILYHDFRSVATKAKAAMNPFGTFVATSPAVPLVVVEMPTFAVAAVPIPSADVSTMAAMVRVVCEIHTHVPAERRRIIIIIIIIVVVVLQLAAHSTRYRTRSCRWYPQTPSTSSRVRLYVAGILCDKPSRRLPDLIR